jgi:hypothetical protein
MNEEVRIGDYVSRVRDIIIVLNENAKPSKVLETLEDLGLDNANVLKTINVITGQAHDAMIPTLRKVSGVKLIEISGEKRCCGGSCGCGQ